MPGDASDPVAVRRRPGRPRTGSARPMAASDHPTSARLVESALRVAARDGLPGMSVDAVVAEAGMSKGAFYGHFHTRDDLLAALHAAWHRRAMDAITSARVGRPLGGTALAACLTGYLDLCLRQPGIRALLVDARSEPTMRAGATRSMAEAAAMVASDLEVLGAPHPAATARLVVGATVETALVELESGQRRDDLRAGLGWLVSGTR